MLEHQPIFSPTFSLVLNGFHEPTAEVEDALFEAGLDDVEKADLGATVLGVEPDDLVNASEIARRVGKTREAVRLTAP